MSKPVIYILIVFNLLWMPEHLRAQDPHYSFFYATGMYLNPAQTAVFDHGFKNQNLRASLQHRQQWRSIPSAVLNTPVPFASTLAGIEYAWAPGGKMKKDFLGIGMQLMNDQTGDLDITTRQIQGSLSYYKSLHHSKYEYISLGFLWGYGQRSIDLSKGTFDNQWNGLTFDPGRSTGELNSKLNVGFQDFGLGGSYLFIPTKGTKINLGISVFHFNKPTLQFYNDFASQTIPIRYLVHGELLLRLNKNYEIQPQMLFQKQGTFGEFQTNALLKIYPSKSGSIAYTMGLGSRMVGNYEQWAATDALMLLAGFRYEKLQLLMAYDANISSLRVASNSIGGFEIALQIHETLGSKKRRMAGKYLKNINECPDELQFEELPH
jgi:type IX secretion system PorP/SprF family membrane protein